MVADPQIQANLGSVAQLTQIQLDLDQTSPADWTYTQRTSYLHALAQNILAYSDQFDAQTLGYAQVVASKDFGQLSADDLWLDPEYGAQFDSYFADNAMALGNDMVSVGVGAGQLLESAGHALGSIGTAVENTSNTLTWALPVAAVLILVMLAQSTTTKVSKQRWLK